MGWEEIRDEMRDERWVEPQRSNGWRKGSAVHSGMSLRQTGPRTRAWEIKYNKKD